MLSPLKGQQKKIARRFCDGKADQVLTLKADQTALHEHVKLYPDDMLHRNFYDIPHDSYTTVEKGHGRFKKWEYFISSELSWLPGATGGAERKSSGLVRATRERKGTSQTETRYYISSLSPDANVFVEAVRAHLGIENSLHWVLDIAFREDDSITVSLIKQDDISKRGVKGKKLKAGWDNSSLEKVLYDAEWPPIRSVLFLCIRPVRTRHFYWQSPGRSV